MIRETWNKDAYFSAVFSSTLCSATTRHPLCGVVHEVETVGDWTEHASMETQRTRQLHCLWS